MNATSTLGPSGRDAQDGGTVPACALDETEALDQAIVDVLNGAEGVFAESDEFLQRCRVHGVSALVAHRLDQRGGSPSEAPGLRKALTAHELFERLHGQRVREVLSAFEREGLECLLLKGTPIASLYYAPASLRTRSDTDLLVDADTFDRVGAILEALGYERLLSAGGTLRSYQASFQRFDAVGCRHVFDVHRRLSDRQVFAKAFVWRELRQGSIGVPALHPTARTLAPVFLLLHACLHRVAHFHSPISIDDLEHRGDRLVWLHDIALIARNLNSEEWRRLADLARNKALSQVTWDGLERANASFPFEVPLDIAKRLRAARDEPSARLLESSTVSVLYEDFRNLQGWRARVRLLAELAFPSPIYMRARYGIGHRAMLPWSYLSRIVKGVRKQLGF